MIHIPERAEYFKNFLFWLAKLTSPSRMCLNVPGKRIQAISDTLRFLDSQVRLPQQEKAKVNPNIAALMLKPHRLYDIPIINVCMYFATHKVSWCCCLVSKLCPTLLQPHGLQPARLLCPWDFLGKNIGVGCPFLLQEIFLTQGLNLSLLHWQVEFFLVLN